MGKFLQDEKPWQANFKAKSGYFSPGARVRMVLRKHKCEDTGAWVYGFRFVLE